MHIENMKQCIESLASAIHGEVSKGVESVCVEEMAEATDMLKDLSEALYYSEITKAMDESKKEEELKVKMGLPTEDNVRYYASRLTSDRYPSDNTYKQRHIPYYPSVYDPMSSDRGGNRNGNGKFESSYDVAKRGYTESKRKHNRNTDDDQEANLESLEDYMRELSSDVTEMIQEASSEELALMKKKLTGLLSKL